MQVALVLDEYHYESASARRGTVAGEEIDALGMQRAFCRRQHVSRCDILTSNIITHLRRVGPLPKYDLAIHFFVPTRRLPGAKSVLFFQQFWEYQRHDVSVYLEEFDAVITNGYHLAQTVPGVLYFPVAVDVEVYRPADSDPSLRCQVLFVANFAERGPEAYAKYLRPALAFDLAIHGRGWDSPAAQQYVRAWRGLLPYDRAARAYSAADLSLSIAIQKKGQLAHWQSVSGRVFHSLACRRMVISDSFPHLCEVLPEGEGVVYANGGEHSREALATYLRDDGARREVAEAGARRVAQYHTWDKRVEQLLHDLGCE